MIILKVTNPTLGLKVETIFNNVKGRSEADIEPVRLGLGMAVRA
jgi:hypothetical protein